MRNAKDSVLSSGIGMTTATVLILLCLEDIASLHRSRGRFCPDLFFFCNFDNLPARGGLYFKNLSV